MKIKIMETNVNYTLVGAFVIALLAAIIMTVIWLSSGFSFQEYETYAVYVKESVSGLTQDSPVEYNGVEVGTVKKISLDVHNPRQVEVLLSIKENTPITEGTVAVLNTRGITGITYVALKDDSTNLKRLKALPGQPYPVIKTAPSIFVRIDAAVTQLTKNFDQLSKSVSSLFDEENQKSIKQILIHLDRVTSELADNSKTMTTILENTSAASKQLTPFIRSGTQAMRTLETQTLPATYELISNLEDITRTLSEVSAEIKQNPSIIIRGVKRTSLGPGEK